MAKEYLEHFASSYPDAEQVLNQAEKKNGAFNIRSVLSGTGIADVINLIFQHHF